MELKTRSLGKSGLEISTVGFGAWAVGGGGWSFGWGPQDDGASITAIRHAVDRGVSWIDTAAIYGLGHSEVVVGRALADIPARERPLVFTKCGLVADPSQPMQPPVPTLAPASIRAECEASLRRLDVERIDLYQLHWSDPETPVEDSWGEMARLVDEGKVRCGGVSNFDVPLLERCERIRHVDSLQPPFSLLKRQAAGDVFPWCAAHGTGVIVYSPMQAGLLTDSFSADRVQRFAPDDWRRGSADFRAPRLSRHLALRDALRPIAVRHGTTVAAVAVAWTLAFRGVSGAICGARTREQVDGWLPAGALTLPREDLEEIAHAIERTRAGLGPALP
ncbi:MAG TPA: aldo/keto reductase [Polyangia bacterium]|jgi:aryl-alcohol dehydrogenase-like predicted oxidoreductase